VRKEVEVALHLGSAVALAAAARPRPRWGLLAAATAPPALVGALLERTIESRLSAPPFAAAGLLAGGVAAGVFALCFVVAVLYIAS
jgi:hypothetical protein